MMQVYNDKKGVDTFLIIERGITEETVQLLALSKSTTIIGRPTLENSPDIKIDDPQISRKHAEICFKDGCFWLRDLGSKNGTTLNNQPIGEKKLYQLTDNSLIGLAVIKDSPRAILRFRQLEGTGQEPVEQITQVPLWLKIVDERKEVQVDGKLLDLPRKEYDLLLFLYRRAGMVCSRDEIIARVWPEARDPGAVSDATIDQLVHRLREKIEPTPSMPVRIVSKKRFGYVLV